MSVANFKYRDSSGNIKEGTLSLEDYRIAADHNMRTSAVVNSRHSDADPQFGSAFEQGAKYLGIFAGAIVATALCLPRSRPSSTAPARIRWPAISWLADRP